MAHKHPNINKKRMVRQESRTLSIHRDPSLENLNLAEDHKYWPIDCANPKVQESDGGFFESFTALAWKQENRRRRAASEDETEASKPCPLEGQPGIKPRLRNISADEFELLYIEVLYTIKHKIGTTTGSHLPFIQDLYHYAREAFGVTPEDHARLLAKASEEKPPILVLEISVVEAKNLEAKDADGFSDPYCMMGIVPGTKLAADSGHSSSNYSSDDENKFSRKESSLKLKFTQSFKRRKDKTARDIIPAKFIRSTTVKPNTLNPVWNEHFRFDLDEVHTDRLHLDIWDHDDEFSVVDAAKRLNEVKSIKGLGRYFKQIGQSARTSSKGNVDDFLGSLNIPVHDIPSTGQDKWFELEGRSARSNVEGQIHLRLRLATREDRGISEEDIQSREIQQHQDLMSTFIYHELKKVRGNKQVWNGVLSQAAQTILHQHAIQGDITDVKQAMCRWIAYSTMHRDHPLDWGLLLKLLQNLNMKWGPDMLSKDEEERLAASFVEFIDYCLGLIKKLREIYPPANKAGGDRLALMLKCLAMLYDTKVFKKCCPFQKELHCEIVSIIKKSCTDWYQRMKGVSQSKPTADDEVVTSLTDLVNKLNTDMQKAFQYYNPHFAHVTNVNYFQVVYKQMEKLLITEIPSTLEEELGEDLQRELAHVSFNIPDVDEARSPEVSAQQMGTHLFELYLALQEFCSFRDHLPSSERRNLSVPQYYEWFKMPIHRWINISKHKLMARIKIAVDLDKVGQVDGHVKQSTSAVDVACCFGQIVDFWKCINWPDYIGALPFITKITEDLCYGAIYYADMIHQKLIKAGYYDEEGQFDVTEQLCITINDIEQVRRALKPLPDALKYNQIAHAMEKTQGEKAGRGTKVHLYGILKAADDNMVKKIKQVVDRVADKMRPDIKKDVFHLCWAPEKVKAEDAIGDLMNYLDSNLVTLNTNLLRANFDRILDSIWVEVLEEIEDVLFKEDVKQMWLFERLYDSLGILVDFFHANGKGLPMEVLSNKHYNDLHRQLQLNKANTKEILEIFYLEKLEEQEKTVESRFGTLSVRVYYNVEAEILSVEVLNGRKLIPLDPNGLSDPFVYIELCPQHVFPQQTIQQTQVIKNSLNPIFDESFEFCVTVAQCRHPGACIVFTVMDHDFLVTNDFGGEAYLSLNTVAGISGEEVSGFSALTPQAMSLTMPKRLSAKQKTKGALAALEIRDTDKEATEFVKKRRTLESQSQA